ncbi:MAG: outer membrane protein transport protein [Rhodospirillales bacterium]|nr:outer membrane protein transport protein [Rhodospirillales bacterium]
MAREPCDPEKTGGQEEADPTKKNAEKTNANYVLEIDRPCGRRRGFGWESKPVFTIGAQHRLNDALTLRAGYNYGPSPIPDDKVFANALFPAITEHHVAAGLSYGIDENWEVSASGFYAFENEQTDDGTGDYFSYAGEGVRVDMWQMGAQVGLSYNF